MVKYSEREQLINEIDDILELMVLDDLDQAPDFLDLIELQMLIKSNRYLNEKTRIPKSSAMNDMLWLWPDDVFKQEVRMSKRCFIIFISMIENHEVFKSKSNHKQKSVWIQAMVVLRRFGGNGNGNSLGRSSRLAGIGVGTVCSYTKRVMTAILSLENDMISWPDDDERRAIAERFHRNYGLKGCVGIIDGTPIVFNQRPAVDGEVYWSRKSEYSMNVQLICDDQMLIRFHLVGWPGSCYDSTVFERSFMYRNPLLFFSINQFLIADAGYGLEWFLCSPFRNPLAQLEHNEIFNYLFSRARCKIEHVNGVLKGRWMSLKSMTAQIRSEADFEYICNWIKCCIILHNFLVMNNDEFVVEVPPPEDVGHDPVSRQLLTFTTIRETVQRNLLNWYYGTNY